MIKRATTWGLLALSAGVLLSAPAAVAQNRPGPNRCRPTDTICRLDGLEARLDYLIEMMERQRNSDRPGRQSYGRSIDIPVSQSCGSGADACSSLAARLCSQGGFARGVPAETTANAFGGMTLNRATCMD